MVHMTTNSTALIVPDLQVPLHDHRFVEKLISVAETLKPDKLFYIGDLTDSTEVGQWVKGKSGEFSGQLQKAFDDVAEIVTAFRDATGWDCQHTLVDSNHDERVKKYVADGAPALSSLRCLDLEELIGLTYASVSYERGPVAVDPHTVAVHGHERPYSSVPGKYGLERVREYGKNVVYGHTHQALLVSNATGYGAKLRNRWAMNVGHAMNVKGASYLKDGFANWSQAFGIVRWDGRRSYPELVQAVEGRFSWNGMIY